MADLLWLIPALPLLGFVLLVSTGRSLGDPKSGYLATLTVAASFAASVGVFFDLLSREAEHRQITQTLFTWVPAGSFRVGMGFLADPLSITMCLFVTGVGALIHLYAIGYMKGDPDFAKFFTYLNLFVFAMLMLVLGDNLLITFLGWEGVGACSYFLIAFWFRDPANASAGKKAFITNRVGDWGFMVGTFLTWTVVGSVSYLDINRAAETGKIVGGTAVAIGLLFFIAATGKSAQIPLFVWLPDAMAGPTPVSALIHAATMVTSGVYLLVRMSPVMLEAGWANDVVAWAGTITALLAATAALAQNDMKKVLAYSTVSQLGYMFMAVGTGSYVAAIFHMVTHAFFKALLFLGAGSVIMGMSHDQDMRHYGNLRKYMPITAGTFIVGWLAIAGIPPFAGFWSKDEILAGVWLFHGGDMSAKVMWAIGVVTAFLTAFYMSRQVMMTFFGEEKWRSLPATDDAGHSSGDHHELTPDHTPRESPWLMTAPLVVLAGLAVLGGLLNLPFSPSLENLGRWLEPVVGEPPTLHGLAAIWKIVFITLLAVVGIGGAVAVYLRGRYPAERIERREFAQAWYIDRAYSWFMGGPGRGFFDGLAWFDRNVIDGAVNGIGILTRGAGRGLRRFQNGQVRAYALGVAVGGVLLLGYFVTRIGF